jgi:hypothetical protein
MKERIIDSMISSYVLIKQHSDEFCFPSHLEHIIIIISLSLPSRSAAID